MNKNFSGTTIKVVFGAMLIAGLGNSCVAMNAKRAAMMGLGIAGGWYGFNKGRTMYKQWKLESFKERHIETSAMTRSIEGEDDYRPKQIDFKLDSLSLIHLKNETLVPKMAVRKVMPKLYLLAHRDGGLFSDLVNTCRGKKESLWLDQLKAMGLSPDDFHVKNIVLSAVTGDVLEGYHICNPIQTFLQKEVDDL